MERIKFDMKLMSYISLFESLTSAKVKDCIDGERLLFIVHEGDIGKAVGKNGVNVRRIGGLLKKDIKIVESSPDMLKFIQNMVYPLKLQAISEEASVVTMTGPDTKTRGLLIGRDAKNLNFLKDVVKRYFDIEDIKVI